MAYFTTFSTKLNILYKFYDYHWYYLFPNRLCRIRLGWPPCRSSVQTGPPVATLPWPCAHAHALCCDVADRRRRAHTFQPQKPVATADPAGARPLNHAHTPPPATVPRDRAAPRAGTTRPHGRDPPPQDPRTDGRDGVSPAHRLQSSRPLLTGPRSHVPPLLFLRPAATVPSHPTTFLLCPRPARSISKQEAAARASRRPWSVVGGGRGEGGDGAAEGCVGRRAGGGGRVRGAAGDDDGEQDQGQLAAQHQLLRLGAGARALLQGRLARVLLHGGAGGRGGGERVRVQPLRRQQRHLQLQQGPQLRLRAQRDQDLLLHLQLRLLPRRDAPRHQVPEAAAAVAAALRPAPPLRRARRAARRGRTLRRRRRPRRAPQDGLA